MNSELLIMLCVCIIVAYGIERLSRWQADQIIKRMLGK